MKWLWLLTSIIPILLAISKSRKNRRVRHDMQFWNTNAGPVNDESDDYVLSVHFPSMLLRWSLADMIPQLCRIRRCSDGHWEYKLTERSNRIDLKRAQMWIMIYENKIKSNSENSNAMLSPKQELEIAKESYKIIQDRIKDNAWLSHNLLDASLETAYQKYIHTQNIPIAKTGWLDEEAKLEEQLDNTLNIK